MTGATAGAADKDSRVWEEKWNVSFRIDCQIKENTLNRMFFKVRSTSKGIIENFCRGRPGTVIKFTDESREKTSRFTSIKKYEKTHLKVNKIYFYLYKIIYMSDIYVYIYNIQTHMYSLYLTILNKIYTKIILLVQYHYHMSHWDSHFTQFNRNFYLRKLLPQWETVTFQSEGNKNLSWK